MRKTNQVNTFMCMHMYLSNIYRDSHKHMHAHTKIIINKYMYLLLLMVAQPFFPQIRYEMMAQPFFENLT